MIQSGVLDVVNCWIKYVETKMLKTILSKTSTIEGNDSSGKNILITGASGMIGSALSRTLLTIGYIVYHLKRNKSEGPFYYLQDSDYMHLDPSIPLHGIVNLAGQNISEKRWNRKVKKQIVDSRVKLTHALSEAITKLPTYPKVFLSGSAIGYYGTDETQIFDENSPAGYDFLACLAAKWEAATEKVIQVGIRTVHLRFGLVLNPNGGVLKNLVLPLRLACVGPIGSGRQILSWISLRDTVNILKHLLEEDRFIGPLNFVADQPVSSREFSQALARSIGRFRLPRIPSSLVRLMFGEMADAALLPSANIQSIRMNELELQLADPELDSALNKMYG